MWDGAVAGDRFVQEVFGQRRVLTGGDDPAWVVAGVDVDQDVQVEPDALVGPRSLVMSQLHTCEGTSARSSGLTLAGWVAWARRSRVCPAAAAIRYMLDREHQYRPSSSSRTHARSKDQRYQRYSARPGRPPSQLGSTPEWAPCARTAVSVGDAP